MNRKYFMNVESVSNTVMAEYFNLVLQPGTL